MLENWSRPELLTLGGILVATLLVILQFIWKLLLRQLEDKIYAFVKEVSSNSVEVHVSRLRKRLAGAGANISVHTLRGVGYLLSEESTIAP